MASLPHVIPGSTNPTLPHTVNTVAEHLDMLMVCHHLSPRVPEDLAFAESRIRATTIAAEDVLHDLGALSITSSDAQAMGRIGEVVCRTWQVAHVMKARRGSLGGSLPADNERARRYVAKYTINPAIAHGIAHEVGSVEVGKLADLVLWDPRFFGIRPELVLKGGAIVRAALGDPNASIPTPQPVLMRPDARRRRRQRPRGHLRGTRRRSRTGWPSRLGLRRRLVAVTPTRDVGKADMVNNDALPRHRRRPRDLRDHDRRRPGRAAAPPPSCPWPSSTRCSEAAMDTLALFLADARLPAAGHTQSGGLEPGLADGLDPADLPAYCRTRLATVTRTEAATAVVARHQAWLAGAAGRGRDRLGGPHAERRDARHLAHAGPRPAPSRPAHLATGGRRLGRRRAAARGRSCWAPSPRRRGSRPRAWPGSWRTTTCRPCWPPRSSCSRSTPPTPPRGASACCPTSTRWRSRLADLTDPADIPATGSPLIEGWAQAHARTTRRLFSA